MLVAPVKRNKLMTVLRSVAITRGRVPGADLGAAFIEGDIADPVQPVLDAPVALDPRGEGFANVAGERRMGRIKVLLVRMNADLLMGEDLKKTGAGNLFTVFGEPDIELRETEDGQVVVDLRGVDVYDPTTGEVRSNDTSQIALWMIDTNYNEESFVRHCYFTVAMTLTAV